MGKSPHLFIEEGRDVALLKQPTYGVVLLVLQVLQYSSDEVPNQP